MMLKNGWGIIARCYGHTKYNAEHSFWQGTRLDCNARRPRNQAWELDKIYKTRKNKSVTHKNMNLNPRDALLRLKMASILIHIYTSIKKASQAAFKNLRSFHNFQF